MAKTDALGLSVWDFDADAAAELPMTRFQLGSKAHLVLAQWCRERTGRTTEDPITVVLRGLHEVLAWFAPEVAFVRHERDADESPGQRLSLYFVGDRTEDPALRRGVQAGLQAWVNLLYPDKPPEVRQQISTAAQADQAWRRLAVGCGLDRHGGACPRAADNLFWDALAAHAADRLKGHVLQLGAGERRMLVPRAGQSSAFDGLELVAYPPKQGDGGLWSEVLTLFTPTFPERDRVHLLARPSIRNWGPVTSWGGFSDPLRTLDVFVPAESADGAAVLRHTSLSFSAREGARLAEGVRAPVKAVWPHKENQSALDLLRRFTGRSALAPEEVAKPVVNENGLWVLPRLGALHGDRNLPGGSGVSWPDRRDIATSLDAPLAAAGFHRAEPMTRNTRAMKLQTPFSAPGEAAQTGPAKRAAVLSALAANDCGQELTLYVLHRLEDTPARVERLLGDLLGPPDQAGNNLLTWNDGLCVRLVFAAAGPLSEQLEQPTVTAEEEAGKTPKQIEALRDLKRKAAADQTEARIAQHIAAVRDGQAGIACALLEMPAALRDRPRTDPFRLSRRELARQGVLPQVVLVEGAKPKTANRPAKPTDDDHQYHSALSDLLRMLGVLPTEAMPRNLAPAAVTIVQRNAEWAGGAFHQSQALALAARMKDGRLEAAVPNEAGAPVWGPYARTALRVLCGEYERFGRGRQADNRARFETFFAQALTDIDRAGPALVLAEGETLRHKLDTFLNGEMVFDRLTLGVDVLTPRDLPNSRLIRLSPDRNRQPSYYQDGTQWPSGLFLWGQAKRTFYGLKAKPVTVSPRQGKAALASRHAAVGENEFPPQVDVSRVSSQLDELCVHLMQPDDDPLDLAHLAHRLRAAHAQTQAVTVQPFPLHELRLLGGGITL
jgi:hypothetical protein